MQHGGFQVIFVSGQLLPVRDHDSLKYQVHTLEPEQRNIDYLKSRNKVKRFM